MYYLELGETLGGSFDQLWRGVISFVPNLVVALLIAIIGWAIGSLIAKAVSRFIAVIKFDEALKQTGLETVMRRSGLNLNTGHFVGGLIKYFIIIVFLIVSFDVLGLNLVTDFLRDIVTLYLPKIIVSVLLLLVGGVLGDVVGKIVATSSKTANLSTANLAGTITRWAIWIIAILAAVSQMGIAQTIIQTLFTGIVVAISLALGLSFGLGGVHAAEKAIEKFQDQISDKK